MTREARALWHIKPDQSEIRTHKLLDPEPGQVEIEAVCSLISTGTERRMAMGDIPREVTDQMRVPHMQGNFPFPITYGYSLVGKIISPSHPWQGRLVHVLHPHQTHAVVGSGDVFLIPEQVPAARATLASNLETAVTAVWDSGASLGDKALVVGFGIIGALVARLLSMIGGAEVTVMDTDLRRRELAEQMGFLTITQASPQVRFDMAFHTSGTSEGLQQAINQVGFEGKIIELSWFGTDAVSVKLGGDFHSQRKQLISSQVSNLPADRLRRWGYRRRKELVFELLQDARFDQLLTEFISFEALPGLFQQIRKGQSKALTWVVDYAAE